MNRGSPFLVAILLGGTLVAGCGSGGGKHPCASVTCSGHGTCSEVNGSASCSCEEGYAPSGATACVLAPCTGVTCSGHGTCSVVDGAASCACDDGYAPSGGTACVLQACNGVTCSGHGSCSIVNGGASCGCEAGYLAAGAECVATGNQVAVPTAPMGWASWNGYAAGIDEAVIKAEADALAASGLDEVGYDHVNIDDGWWDGQRDANGDIPAASYTVNGHVKWPSGMDGMAAYIHGLGLKAGIYTDAGLQGCGHYYPTNYGADPTPNDNGSEGHYDQDYLQFQRWGFDYVKVDWCGGRVEKLDAPTQYQQISDAIAAATASTGRPMELSICEWGSQQSWNWAAGLGQLWRTDNDLVFWGQQASLSAAVTAFNRTLHPTSQHTGYFNDPDMLTVGMAGLTAAGGRTEMNLWAISGAPLLAGNKPSEMTPEIETILGNPEVIAIDQDPRGLQGFKVSEESLGLKVYGKVLAGAGRRAVLLFNDTDAAATMTVRWADLGLTSDAAAVRDVWAHANLGSVATSYATAVPARDSVMLTVTGTEAGGFTVEAEDAASVLVGTTRDDCPSCSGGKAIGWLGHDYYWNQDNTLAMTITAPSSGLYLANIGYITGETRYAKLQVNREAGGGQYSTWVAFPSSGGWSTVGTVSVILSLHKGTNSLYFFNTVGWGPNLDAVTLQPLTVGHELIRQSDGLCVDLPGNKNEDGLRPGTWACSGGPNQVFQQTSRNELVVDGYQCLDVASQGTTPGAQVVLWPCNGQPNEQWDFNADGTITGVQSGLCLEDSGGLQIDTCDGSAAQKWTLN